jgi:hypothetical protein
MNPLQHLERTARAEASVRMPAIKRTHPVVWARDQLGPGDPVEFMCERLLHGACDWAQRFYVSVSPGRYRVHLALDQGRVYDGQDQLEAVETKPLCQADVDQLVRFLGPAFRAPLSVAGQFSRFDFPILTRHRADRLQLTLIPAKRRCAFDDIRAVTNEPDAHVARLLFQRKCDPTRSVKPESVLLVTDKAGRLIFAHPPSLLRETCRPAWTAFVRRHDAADAYFRYDVRSDLKLMNRNMIRPDPLPDARILQGTVPVRGLCPRPTARAAVGFTSKDRLRFAVSLPEVVTDLSWADPRLYEDTRHQRAGIARR